MAADSRTTWTDRLYSRAYCYRQANSWYVACRIRWAGVVERIVDSFGKSNSDISVCFQLVPVCLTRFRPAKESFTSCTSASLRHEYPK